MDLTDLDWALVLFNVKICEESRGHSGYFFFSVTPASSFLFYYFFKNLFIFKFFSCSKHFICIESFNFYNNLIR